MSFAKHESSMGFTDPILFSHVLVVPWRGASHSSSVHWLKTQQLFCLKFYFEKPIGVLQMGVFAGRSAISSSWDEGVHEQDTEWSNVHFKVMHSWGLSPLEFLN